MNKAGGTPVFYRLLLPFLAVSLLTSSLLVLVSYVFSSEAVENRAREAVRLQLATIGQSFDATYGERLTNALKRLASSTVLDDYLLGSENERVITAKKLERLFLQTTAEQKSIVAIYYVDPFGHARIATEGKIRVRSFAADESGPEMEAAWLTFEALQAQLPGTLHCEGPYVGESGEVSATVGVSKLDLDTGGFGGVIMIRVSFEPFFADLDGRRLFEKSPLWVVSYEGELLRQPASEEATFRPEARLLSALDGVNSTGAGPRLASVEEGLIADEPLFLIAEEPLLRLVACLPEQLLMKDVSRVLRFFSVVLLVSIIIVVTVSAYIARYLSSSIRELADAAMKLAKGDLSTRVELSSPSSEIRLLTESFNTMASERKQAEDALRVSERRFRSLVEEATDAMFVVDRITGQFVDVNQEACDGLGYDREELLALRVVDLQQDHSWEELSEAWKKLEPGKPITVEGHHQRKDGSIFPVEVRIGPFESDERPLLLATARNITERRRTEEARVRAEQALEKQRTLSMRSDRLRSLGEMAAGIAHELNQPLVGVRGIAEHILIALEKGWDLGREKLAERATTIVAQADRMTHIIEHVRLFARESGKPELSPVHVNDVVTSAIELLGAQMSTQGIEVVTDLEASLRPVTANPYSLEEVFLNPLSNARDAIGERTGADLPLAGGRISVRTRAIDNGSANSYVRMEVADNGPGIPEAIAARVFDPFFTTKDPDKGTGLGLAICKSIIEQFDGDLDLSSTAGAGTTMTVTLPSDSVEQ